MKKLILLLTAAVLILGVWWFFHRKQDEQADYQAVPVTRGDLTQAVTATGQLSPIKNVTVGSQISGNILEIFSDFNSPVKAGQVIAQLDPAIYQAVVHQVEGELASSKAALELAQLTAKRKKELVAQHAAAQADLDSAVATLHQAEATVQVKAANLEKAKVDLDHCTIYSPINGTVISRNVDVGQTVAAAMNAPVLFTIANDLTKMEIHANVAEADVGIVEPEQSVDFTVDAFPYRIFQGTVSQVRNAATTIQNVVTYNVVISVDNAELKLKPGMTANVSIVIAHHEDALKLPNAALRFRMPDQPETTTTATSPTPAKRPARKHLAERRADKTVYVLPTSGATPQPTTVRLGVSDGVSTEVLEGLKEGDNVVIGSNVPQVRPGQTAPNPFGGGIRRF